MNEKKWTSFQLPTEDVAMWLNNSDRQMRTGDGVPLVFVVGDNRNATIIYLDRVYMPDDSGA